MRVRLKKERIYFCIFLFLFIFAPPIIKNINFLYFVTLFSAWRIIMCYRKKAAFVIFNPFIKKFNISFFTFIVYILIRTIIDAWYVNRLPSRGYFVALYRLIGVAIVIQIPVIYAVCHCIKYEYKFKDLCMCIMGAGMIEGVFTYLCIVSPRIKSILVNIFISNQYGSIENLNWGSWIYNERLFGFANVLFDGFGYGTGIIAGIAFIYIFASKSKIKSVVLFFMLLVIPTVNSITGLFIVCIAVLVVMGGALKRKKINRAFFYVIVVGAFIAVVGGIILSKVAPSSIQRLLDNLYAIMGKDTMASTTSFNILFNDSFWQLPNTINGFIWGTGHDIYNERGFKHSDVGYVNMIWLCGLTGCIWLYGMFLRLFKNGLKNSKDYCQKEVVIFVLLAFLFFEIKGIGIAINTATPIILLILYYSIIYKERDQL